MKRPKRLSKIEGVVSHIAKPDIDNLLKSVMDGLTECGVIVDDSQICQHASVKVYHDRESSPHAVVELGWLATE